MAQLARMQALLGGEGPLRSEADVDRLARRGVSTKAVNDFLAAAGLEFPVIDSLVARRRTFRRREQAAEPLDRDESDRMLRLVRLVAEAQETFGDDEKARAWLHRPNRVLQGERPIDLLATDAGARQVEVLLGRIAHGIAA